MNSATELNGSNHDESVGILSPRPQNGTSNAAGPQQPLPKCFCNWKHCRTYQKAFREFKHPFYNGVIKLKFHENDPRSMGLKESIDRCLGVEPSKRNDWKSVGETIPEGGSGGDRFSRYYVARHHFTELLMRHYLTNRRTWDWNEPLAMEEAQRFLYSLDPSTVYQEEGNDESPRYIQVPNVPKEQVRELLKQLKQQKEENTRQRNLSGEGGRNVNSTPPTEPLSPFLTPSQSTRRRATTDLAPVAPLTTRGDADEDVPSSTHSRKSKNHNKTSNNSNSTKATARSSTITKEEIVIESEDYDDSDEEESDDDDVRYSKNRREKQSRSRNGVKSKRKQAAKEDDNSSIASPHSLAIVAQKEEENLKLRSELEDCQNKISMLQSIVEKLEEHLNVRDPDTREKPARQNSGSARKNRTNKSKAKNTTKVRNKRKKKESLSSHDDDDDDVDLSDIDRKADDEPESASSSEEEDDDEESSEEETTSRNYNYTGGGNGAMAGRRQKSTDRSRNNNRQSLRRGSIHSRRSIVSRSSRHHSRRGSMRGGDDGASVMSRQSLQSISVSIKSLPREIELMDDDDEDDMRGNKDDSSYFDDTRSLGSRSANSRVSRRSLVSGTRIRNRKSTARSSAAANRGRRSGRSNNRGAVPQEIDLSGDELENLDETHANVSTDTLFVKEKQIVDPYGEKGVYTGALSKSTCMPNGKGRLEYEKESRWYEGDWIHGRWTGYGRLSNGDGDFYEGGLKNDHKHGTGIMRFADGRVFEGEYIRGQMIQGKMTYQDGSVYGGSWVDGMRHGRGKCIFVDGSEYEGEFREGNFHGQGKMTWNDGGWYVGNWSNGEMDGQGKEVRPDGSLRHDGEWAGGQPIRSASDTRRRRQQQQDRSNGED